MRSEYHEGLKSLNRDQAVQIGLSSVLACDHVRLLELIISAELSLDRHVSFVTSFYWLRQLRASNRKFRSRVSYFKPLVPCRLRELSEAVSNNQVAR